MRAHVPPGAWRATLLVARKEIVTSFRDRQSTLYMVVLPIVLYPFLFWCLIQGSLFLQAKRERAEVGIGVASASSQVPSGLLDALARPPDRGERAVNSAHRIASARATDREPTRVVEADQPLDELAARHWLEPDVAHSSAASARRPDAVLFLPERRAEPPRVDGDGAPLTDSEEYSSRANAAQNGANGSARVFYDSTRARSDIARARTEERVEHFADSVRASGATIAGRPPHSIEGVAIDAAEDVAPDKDVRTYLLSILLPMLLVVMTVMGAFFPAVDLTAGERERNTRETTLLLPVPARAVHQGKILAVCAGAMIATVLNLLALALSAGHLIGLLRAGANVDVRVPFQAFLAVLPLALLFAFFVSSVLTAVASRARTFKEGQALLGPVQLAFIVPALAGAIPGLALTPRLSVVPVLNVVLAFRALLKSEAHPLAYTLTALSLLAYASLAVWIAMRWIGRDAPSAASRRRGALAP